VVVERLLTEARAEADSLRKRLRRVEKIIVSSRLIMGHELKKPTTAISGYLDLVCEDLERLGELTTLAYAEKAQHECALLDDLNTFFLELLRVDSSEETVGQARVDVASLLGDLIGHFPPRLNAADRVTCNVDASIGPIDFNPNALKLIMLNLIENALLYSQKNAPVRVEVKCDEEKRRMRGGKILKVRIKDDGVGIPPEFIKKIFNPFVRLREDIADGSGLGLTLVRSLVELNGGEVYVRSALNKGTTVYVTIPTRLRDWKEPPVEL
jgi:two-component system sensor histidine kinase/response regulator